MAPVSEHRHLQAAAAEVEAHVGQAGWDQRPAVFALVRAQQLLTEQPALAQQLGLERAEPDALVPMEQDPLPEQALDDALARLAWPDAVDGAALSQEIVILPPSVQDELPDDAQQAAELAAAHPQRREARLVVAVLREGGATAVLRLRAAGEQEDELLTGANLAPNLVQALHATFAD